jgi:hypothetical protein
VALLGSLPIPKFRTALSGLLLRITRVLGDSYMFAENKTQQAAIITKARKDLAWVAARCEHVVVLHRLRHGEHACHRAVLAAR